MALDDAKEKGTTLQRIQKLLDQLAAEHAAEIDLLKHDIRRLQESAPAASPSVEAAPEKEEKEEEEEDEVGNFLPELDMLREAAELAVPAPPPTGTRLSLADSDDEQASKAEHPGTSLSIDADSFGMENDDACPVRAVIYSVQDLPASLFPGKMTLEGALCKLVVKSDSIEDCTSCVALQQETGIPGQASQAAGFKAVWEETGTDVLLHLPRPLPQQVQVEFQIEGQDTAIATGLVTMNAQRQNWTLFGGGFVDAEIVVEKAETPAGRRRASTVRDRIIEKLHTLFDVRDPFSKVVMPNDVTNAVRAARNKKSSQLMSSLGPEEMEEVVLELKRIHQKAIDKEHKGRQAVQQPVISWKQFQDCIMLEELPKYSAGPVALNLFIVQQALLGDDMPSTGTSGALLMAYEKVRKPVSPSQKYVNIVTAMSTGAILISFLFLGMSLDVDPDWAGWIVFDGMFALVFVAEVVVKTIVMSPREYFCGRDCVWNSFDLCLSAVAVGETVLNIFFATAGSEMKAALFLRGLRLARMARLAKLMRMPLMEELANIVSGFVISVRSLFWVMVTLLIVVYVLALGFRATVQTVSKNALGTCGYGDLIDLDDDLFTEDHSNTPCKLHYMYGEEYCGSVLGCMFSIFRCMIGECTSKGGRSLTMVFSDGFGIRFDIFYAVSMVVVLFGLFNIITAIFVEATLNGLKENETHRRYAKAYESSYMTEQLAKLVMVLSAQIQKMRSRTSSLPNLLQDTMLQGAINFSMGSDQNHGTASAHLHSEETYLSEEEFNQLIRMPDVRMLLNDLDVSVEPRPGVFEAFNVEEDGTVSISELVSGLMRLRGDLHKVDLVIAQMGLEHMQKQMNELRSSHAQVARKLGVGRSMTFSRVPSSADIPTR